MPREKTIEAVLRKFSINRMKNTSIKKPAEHGVVAAGNFLGKIVSHSRDAGHEVFLAPNFLTLYNGKDPIERDISIHLSLEILVEVNGEVEIKLPSIRIVTGSIVEPGE